MFGKLIEIVSGKDDVERVAGKNDPVALDELLKTRRLLIPRRPKVFLDAANMTQEQFQEMIKTESKDVAGEQFEPWVLASDGKRRLPAFSSQKKMETFSKRISQDLGKVFALGSVEVLIGDITKNLDLDFVDLNLFSGLSWEICVRNKVREDQHAAADGLL